MNEYYFAPVYDFLLQPFIHQLRRSVVAMVLKHKSEKVIDMCCGTGHQLKYLENAGIKSVGVDLNDLMIRQAGRNNSKDLCNKGDARSTNYPDNHFDMALTSLSLHEMPYQNAREIIQEMIRVVKPDGQLMIIDYDFTEHSSNLMKSGMKMIEYFVGGKHYRNFRKYIKLGQMQSLVQDFNLNPTETRYFYGNTIALRIYSKT
ncbi:MAG: class I SAM-dependent methyltransferase [Bacteroidales bacterium]|nr:class I SAM-dependent methyltransferase [Bacteroidales bacterium]